MRLWPFTRKTARRKKSRPQQNHRSFTAAQGGNLVASWVNTPTNIDSALVNGLRPLRARSRDLMRNTPFARRFRAMVQANVIGAKGVGFSSKVTNTGNDNPDDRARSAIEDSWMDWGYEADFRQALHLVDMERLVIGCVVTDGEAFIRKRRNPGLRNGFALEMVDAELIDVRHNVDKLPGGRSVRMGIERDKHGRVTAYYLGDPPSTAYSGYYSASNTTRRVPASDMIHVFIREEVGQTRGIPWLAAAMLRYNMLDGYMEAALVAARTGAAKALAIYTEDGDFTGDDEDDDGAPIIDLSEPGVAWNLRTNQKIEGWDPSYPHGEMPDFIKTCLREISAGSGHGVSYNLLSGDLEGVSFSSIRHAIIEEQGQWMALQEWFIREFMRPVFMDWIAASVEGGHIKIGANALRPSDLPRYKKHAWRPRRWSWIDPMKDVQAAKLQVAEGFKSRTMVRDELGVDSDDVIKELAEDNAELAAVPSPAKEGGNGQGA